jgi:hypothetical protein
MLGVTRDISAIRYRFQKAIKFRRRESEYQKVGTRLIEICAQVEEWSTEEETESEVKAIFIP